MLWMRSDSLSWPEPNKLPASPLEARPQGGSYQQWQHGQMQHGERPKRLKQNTVLHNDVSNKLNDKHKEQLNDK